ncbi:NDH-dependent cyclic electron flow 5 [Tasmannia lanceolata]|uniref:NDH-dependent cyclic electron flow 5 n=1 Tax=Tasmannia lanceolata TaxID=3420 RepID=UPI00406346B4
MLQLEKAKATAMANSFLFSSNPSPLTITNPSKHFNSFYTCILPFKSHHGKHKGGFSLFVSATSSTSPINVEYLEREFSGHGVSFAGLGESCVVRMGMENGSMASLMLPSGLITSYKPHMWHGGTVEVLHTSVSEGEDGDALIQGGMSVGLGCESDGGMSWCPSIWSLHDVRGSPQKSIQVELICNDSEDKVEVKYLVTLQQDLLSSELMITNLKSTSLHLMGSLISHLTVSTPDATYAIGLQGSNYFSKPPMESNFSIIPPGFDMERNSEGSWGQTAALQGLFSNWGMRGNKDEEDSKGKGEPEEEIEGEEDDNYMQLTEKISRIYTSAPRRFTVLDRGRRNSVIVGRAGFDELYVFSPGSNYEWYGKYAYICTGPSAMLKPVVLGPEGVWRGAQYLHNPNL